MECGTNFYITFSHMENHDENFKRIKTVNVSQMHIILQKPLQQEDPSESKKYLFK